MTTISHPPTIDDFAMNDRAWRIADDMSARSAELRVTSTRLENGTRVIDAGIDARGGLGAGLALVRICMGGLGHVSYEPVVIGGEPFPGVQVWTDHPAISCMASQYAGWAVKTSGFFGMGSGPLRAHARVEHELFAKLGYTEIASRGVLVLETRQMPTEGVSAAIAERAALDPSQLALVVAPTASIAGCVQIVARSLETGLHKMDSLGFDVTRVVSGVGTAPVPPVPAADNVAIGRTNDCILYGAQARYTVDASDDRARVSRGAAPGRCLARLRHAVPRDLCAVQQRLLQDRPTALQSGRGLAHELPKRSYVSRWAAQSGRAEAIAVHIAADVHITLLSAREGWHTDQLRRAMGERGIDSSVRAYETLVARIGHRSGGESAGPPLGIDSDAVLSRIIPNGSLEQIIFRVDALHWLEERGILVMNSPRAIERSVDKFYTSALLQQAGIPTPETVVCERSEDALAAFRSMADVIVKPLFGSMGLGMVRLADEETAWRVFRALECDPRRVLSATHDRSWRPRRARLRRRRPCHRRDGAPRIGSRARLANELLAGRPRQPVRASRAVGRARRVRGECGRRGLRRCRSAP